MSSPLSSGSLVRPRNFGGEAVLREEWEFPKRPPFACSETCPTCSRGGDVLNLAVNSWYWRCRASNFRAQAEPKAQFVGHQVTVRRAGIWKRSGFYRIEESLPAARPLLPRRKPAALWPGSRTARRARANASSCGLRERSLPFLSVVHTIHSGNSIDLGDPSGQMGYEPHLPLPRFGYLPDRPSLVALPGGTVNSAEEHRARTEGDSPRLPGRGCVSLTAARCIRSPRSLRPELAVGRRNKDHKSGKGLFFIASPMAWFKIGP